MALCNEAMQTLTAMQKTVSKSALISPVLAES